jgi:tRNA (guanine9-N1)-methyltransferase
VNQVFEILLHWVEKRDWEHAFHMVIPKRKFQVGSKRPTEPKGGEEEDDRGSGADDGQETELGASKEGE